MKVKKYRAPDRTAALKQIRAELGPEAVIVHEQRVRPAFFGLLGKPQVEVLAAIEDEHLDGGQPVAASGKKDVAAAISPAARQLAATSPSARPATASNVRLPGGLSDEGASKLAAILETFPKNGQQVPPAMAASLADLVARAMPAEAEEESRTQPEPAPAPVPPPGKDVEAAPAATQASPDGEGLGSVQQSLLALQNAVQRLTQQSQDSQLPREAPALRLAYQQLIVQEMDPSLALDIAGTISEELGGDLYVEQAQVFDRVVELLEQRLRAGSLELPARGEGVAGPAVVGPAVAILVGPTGVGKTTTLAKLASHLAFVEGKKVALITTDTFRIAAAAQLGTYADILGLPLEVVYRAENLPAALAKHQDVDVVLMDTPGCGQQDQVQIEELSSFVRTTLEIAPAASVLLTVAAPTKLRDLLHIRQGFGTMPIHGLILTKLDETTAYGPIVSFAARAAEPVYYLTTGQKVPHDIEPAVPVRIAQLVVSGASREEPHDSSGVSGATQEVGA